MASIILHQMIGGSESIADCVAAVKQCPAAAPPALAHAVKALEAADASDDGLAVLVLESLFAIQGMNAVRREDVKERLADTLARFWANEYRRVQAEVN